MRWAPRYLDRNGNPMTLAEWATAYEDPRGRVIAETVVPIPEVSVVTVWNGVDADASAEPPLIFTTVLRRGGRSFVESRTATVADALSDHAVLETLAAARYGPATENGIQAAHYTSTHCIHLQHDQCRKTCKICKQPCLCGCHADHGKAPG